MLCKHWRDLWWNCFSKRTGWKEITYAFSPLLKDITFAALTTNIWIKKGLDPTLETLCLYVCVCVILSLPPPPLLFETSICAHTGWSQLRFVFLIRHRSVIAATPRFTVCPPTLSISDDRLLNSEAAPPLIADPTYWTYIQLDEVFLSFVRLLQNHFHRKKKQYNGVSSRNLS